MSKEKTPDLISKYDDFLTELLEEDPITDKEMALRCRRRAEKEFGYVYHTKA